MKTFRELIVWQKSMDFVTEIYKVSKPFPDDEKFGLTSQMRRSAVSIPSNIAEGAGRKGEKERRETEQLNRTQAQITGQQQAQVAARQNQASIIAGGVSAVGNIASSAVSGYGAQQANNNLKTGSN